MTVRLARPSDLAVALPLWQALHREHEALDARYRIAADAASRWQTSFRDWTRSPSSRVWLALEGGDALGLATAHLYQPAPVYQPSLMVHVDDLYVAPPARGHGVGAVLLDHAREWAALEGATEIRVGVLASNAAGRAFWERQGARDYSVTMTLGVGGGR